jgi:sulfotransferase
MSTGIHFISGLPRSGSTLFSALLRQNPHFCAGMSSPVMPIYAATQLALSTKNEFHVFITDRQRE